MYAVVRSDLAMAPGKLASQAGHAFLGAFLQNQDSQVLSDYHKDLPESPGTKVVLKAPSLYAIERAKEELKQLGVPHFLVVDSGCQNFFNGEPTVTALGFGPVRKSQLGKITKRLNVL
jgi:peptidyl-tRNA hydrolase